MKLCPQRRPIISRSSQKARDTKSSARSLRSSTPKLRERKEHVLQRAGGETGLREQLIEPAGGGGAAIVQQQKAVADAGGVAQLMNREDERASFRVAPAEQCSHEARLTEIETIERLVEQQERLRRRDRERHAEPFRLAFRERFQLLLQK